ncbi:MAG: indole-3-glycerol phosphate synthase TrpC [Desulfobacterales bacterium]|jgi:indole-3-glycerol phosphate synthase|nr:indole-3-glycerol phosphate synthase TrpC [Desulfobacterales bacterium]
MAHDLLERIVAAKRAQIEAARRTIAESRLRAAAERRRDIRPFEERLRSPGPSGANIIAEIKRASPSKGPIAAHLDPAALAADYAAGGAAALSVLTETDFFLGSADDLARARRACELPVLRKDFIICPYQLYESAAMGADAVLLIVRILPEEDLRRLLELSAGLGLAALVEVFSEQDLAAAGRAGARLIGINNRDLRSFDTDRDRTLRLLPRLLPRQVAVAASGIRTRADILHYQKRGVFNFLIGESLVRSEHPAGFLRMLQGES